MNTPPFNGGPVPEMGIPDAISQALNDIIAEHFGAKLAQLNANVADLMTIFDIDTSMEDGFSYGSLEFTSAQADFIRTSLLNKDLFFISFNGGDATEIRSRLSERVRGQTIQGGVEGINIEEQIRLYMTRNNFPVIEGQFIGVDAKPFLNQCRGIVEIGFRQLIRHTIGQHLIYLRGKAQEIQRKSVLAIASPDADLQKKTVLETSLTRGRHPCIIVNKDNSLELSLNLFSAPLGCFNTNGGLIVPVEQADVAIDENAYGESLFRPDSQVFPFIEHGNILSFHRLFFGDSPFEVTEGLTHWGNLDTDHGRFLSFFLDPRKDIVGLFDQCIKLICDDPEVGLELISDDRSDPNTHSSGLPGIIQFRVRSPEEIDEMYQSEAVAAPQDIGRAVRVPGGVPAGSGGITGLVRRLVGATIR